MHAPTIAEQIEVIEDFKQTLRDSYREADGALTDPVILREIECLDSTLEILKAMPQG